MWQVFGEEEMAKLEENKVNQVKIHKLAKLLNRLLLFKLLSRQRR